MELTLQKLSAVVLAVLAGTAFTVSEYVASQRAVPEPPRTRVCTLRSFDRPADPGSCFERRLPDCPCARTRRAS